MKLSSRAHISQPLTFHRNIPDWSQQFGWENVLIDACIAVEKSLYYYLRWPDLWMFHSLCLRPSVQRTTWPRIVVQTFAQPVDVDTHMRSKLCFRAFRVFGFSGTERTAVCQGLWSVVVCAKLGQLFPHSVWNVAHVPFQCISRHSAHIINCNACVSFRSPVTVFLNVCWCDLSRL